MLRYAIIFLIITIIVGVLSFGGIAGTSVGVATILFFVFLVLFTISFVLKLLKR